MAKKQAMKIRWWHGIVLKNDNKRQDKNTVVMDFRKRHVWSQGCEARDCMRTPSRLFW